MAFTCPWWVSGTCSQSSRPESGEQKGTACSATQQLGNLGRSPSSRQLSHWQRERLGGLVPGRTGQPLISTWGYVAGRDQGELGYQTGVHKSHLFHSKSGEREEGLGISNQSVINNSTAAQGASSVQSPFKIPGLGVCLGSSSGDCAFCLPPLPRPPLPSSALTAL